MPGESGFLFCFFFQYEHLQPFFVIFNSSSTNHWSPESRNLCILYQIK